MSPPDDSRVDQIVSLVTRLANGELSAREEPSETGDDLDAIITGVNMLAEELEASHTDLERRVASRTAQIALLNDEIMKLTELGQVLQACETHEEAYDVIRRGVRLIFSELRGEVYLFNASRNLLELAVAWGGTCPAEQLVREDCWALRRGQPYLVQDATLAMPCAHSGAAVGDSLCIPMSARGETTGLLHLSPASGGSAETDGIAASEQQIGAAVGAQIAMCLANLDLRESLRNQALRDPLTGLYNRRFLDEWIDREIKRAERAGTSVGVIMADVDHFKLMNDQYGHVAGDAVLTAVGTTLRTTLRAGDLPCRYGGEEFLILLTDISREDLVARADHLREQIALTRVELAGTVLPAVTISMGVAVYPEHGGSTSLVIRAADEALYRAKRAGRDRVVIADTS